MEKMTDHQYGQNSYRNIQSNYNQMRAMLNALQINKKKLYLIDLSIGNRRNIEGSGNMPAIAESEFCQSI